MYICTVLIYFIISHFATKLVYSTWTLSLNLMFSVWLEIWNEEYGGEVSKQNSCFHHSFLKLPESHDIKGCYIEFGCPNGVFRLYLRENRKIPQLLL